MRDLTLSAETQAIFDRIGSYTRTLNVYGMSQSRASARPAAQSSRSVGSTGMASWSSTADRVERDPGSAAPRQPRTTRARGPRWTRAAVRKPRSTAESS